MKPTIYPGRILTVVIRNDGPMLHSGDSPTYRSVRLTLNDEQVGQLALRQYGQWGGESLYEEISRCFIEPED